MSEASKTHDMPVRSTSPEEMAGRVARYGELQCPTDRYLDSQTPGNERKNYLVVGTGIVIDGGKDPMSAIPVQEGFQLSYIEAKPGNGPKLHCHDTNETFIALKGTWRVICGQDPEYSIDLNPLDVFAVPPFVPRRFVCLTPDEGQEVGLLQSIQAGDFPRVEYM